MDQYHNSMLIGRSQTLKNICSIFPLYDLKNKTKHRQNQPLELEVRTVVNFAGRQHLVGIMRGTSGVLVFALVLGIWYIVKTNQTVYLRVVYFYMCMLCLKKSSKTKTKKKVGPTCKKI